MMALEHIQDYLFDFSDQSLLSLQRQSYKYDESTKVIGEFQQSLWIRSRIFHAS
jgi:hypothetical protein